jgi:hypothetical protein
MKLVTRGIEATAWLEEFARTTVASAPGREPHEPLAEAAPMLEVARFERAERKRERSAAATHAAA